MFRFIVILLFPILLFVGAVHARAADPAPSVVLNQVSPVFGQDIDFTIVYPSEAARSHHNSSFHDQPQVQVDCTQGSTPVFRQAAIVASKTKINGTQSWQALTTSMNLSANGGNGYLWTSGGADCTATLFYFDQNFQLQVLAFTQFAVGP